MGNQINSYQIVLETNTVKMSANQVINVECPICMESIDGLCNRVVTECGHAFHCACLMQNAAHNGFGCPYCRTVMAAEPKEEEDDEDDDGWSIEETVFEEDALTSFRLFHQRTNGEELEEEELEEDDDWGTDDEEEAVEEPEAQAPEAQAPVTAEEPVAQTPVAQTPVAQTPVRPSVPDSTYMSNKLVERGITYEDLVKHILNLEHDEWGEHYREYTRRSDEVYGKFRAVMSNYARNRTPNQISTTANQNPVVTTALTPVLNPVLNLPEVAESKTPVITASRAREVLTHA
jgi:hypothetical protein